MLNASEIAWMSATVASSLDQLLPLYRKTVVQDTYGHSSETYPGQPTLMLACTVSKPTATTLAAYADVIAGKRAVMLRYMPTSDVREGDRIDYAGVHWKVNPIESAESYTFTNEVLITALT